MLFAELKRRNVFRVAVAYLAVSWLVIEVAETLLPAFGIPDWAFRFVVILLALGFLPTLIFSWAYEITPEGVKRESEVVREASITHLTAKRLDALTIVVIIVAAGFLIVDRYWLDPRLSEHTVPSPAGTAVQPPSSAKTGAAHFRSIAVLPFANRSANPSDAYFVDGIHDDLLTHISHIESIKTISRTSVMRYRETTKPIPEIARELEVDTVLEGGVQRAGEHVRINVQLIDARTDAHLWSEMYDRQLSAANIFAIQSEIARSIADALRAKLTSGASARFRNAPTDNLDALDAYFRGRQRMATRSVDALAEAIDHFGNAVTLDGNFALAYVGLADAYRLHTTYAGIFSADSYQKAQDAVDKALALDPQLGEAYATLATLTLPDLENAERAFKKALALNPNYAPTYQWYGEALSGFRPDRLPEALGLMRNALSLDPMSAIINNDYAEVLEIAGEFDDALKQYERAIEIDPRFVSGYRRIGELNASAYGRFDAAIRAFLKSDTMEPGQWLTASFLGEMYLNLGDLQQAQLWSDRAVALAPPGAALGLPMLVHRYRGDTAASLAGARDVQAAHARSLPALQLLAHADLTSGDFAAARERYLAAFPELARDNAKLPARGLLAAGELAIILWKAGEQETSEQLIQRCEASMAMLPRLGYAGYGILDARLLALRGDHSAALATLGRAVQQGWRHNWWYLLQHDPVLQVLHDEPEFQLIKRRIEVDVAAQLAGLPGA
jgi:TolB-like protein/Tfp pilus assembly protein PilF